MLLLAIQFGMQPIFTKEFVAGDAHKPTLVLLCELLKIVFAVVMLFASLGQEDCGKMLRSWSPAVSAKIAAVPAAIYALQNICIQIGYQRLSGAEFNVLNQIKIAAACFMVYIFMGRLVSGVQMIALMMVTCSSILLSMPEESGELGMESQESAEGRRMGVAATLLASLLSGTAAALSQRATRKR